MARPSLLTEKLLLFVESIGQSDQKLGTAFDSGHLVAWPRLQAGGHGLGGELAEAVLVYLKLVVAISGEETLEPREVSSATRIPFNRQVETWTTYRLERFQTSNGDSF